MAQNETEKKKKKKFAEVMKDSLQKIVLVLISVFYISQGIFELVKKDTSITDILGSIGLSVVVGLIISSSLSTMGLKDGRKSEEFTNSMIAYGVAKKNATPYFYKLSAWCQYKNQQSLKEKKRDIIDGASLSWKAYRFGYYDEHPEKLSKEGKKAIFNAKHCKIAKITSREMLSDFPKAKSGIFGSNNAFGESEADYKRRDVFGSFLSKLIVGIVCGLFGLTPLITQENKMQVIAGIIWNASQIIMWITLGLTKYYGAKAFIINEYRQSHIIEKTELFNEFVNTMEKNPEVIEKTEEDIEIDRYIQEYLNQKEKLKNEQREDEQKTILE